MSVHELAIEVNPGEEPRVVLVCNATPDALCRRRPPNFEDREDGWTAEEAIEPGHECWAVEFVQKVGLEALEYEDLKPVIIGRVPITISYEEGVVWGLAPEATPLPDPEITRLQAEVERLNAELDYETKIANSTARHLEVRRKQIEAVKALHVPVDVKLYAATVKECAFCPGLYPCPTIRALTEGETTKENN